MACSGEGRVAEHQLAGVLRAACEVEGLTCVAIAGEEVHPALYVEIGGILVDVAVPSEVTAPSGFDGLVAAWEKVRGAWRVTALAVELSEVVSCSGHHLESEPQTGCVSADQTCTFGMLAAVANTQMSFTG